MEKLLGCGPGLLISCSVLPGLSLFLPWHFPGTYCPTPGPCGMEMGSPQTRTAAGSEQVFAPDARGKELEETRWPGRPFCLLDPNMFPKQREPCEGSLPEWETATLIVCLAPAGCPPCPHQHPSFLSESVKLTNPKEPQSELDLGKIQSLLAINIPLQDA